MISTGSSLSRAKLCIPTPKSSMAMRQPRARSSSSSRLACSAVKMATVSVISKHSRDSGNGACSSSSSKRRRKLPEARLWPVRLTEMLAQVAANSGASRNCANSSVTTARSSSGPRRAASTAGRNRPGASRLPCPSLSRHSTSPTVRPRGEIRCSGTTGWKHSCSPPGRRRWASTSLAPYMRSCACRSVGWVASAYIGSTSLLPRASKARLDACISAASRSSPVSPPKRATPR